MDNLEICKRIAEIEGLLISGHTVGYDDLWVHTCPTVDSSVTLYNPFDDALCFQLMVKYSIDLTHDFSGLWCASMNPTYTHDECVENYGVISYDKNPNFAILLVIIEAHKES